MMRRAMLAGLAMLATATCLWAGRIGVVMTIDGQTYEGDIAEKDDQLIVNSHGVGTVLARDRVASIDYTPYDERFRKALAELEAEDVDGRVALARAAFDRREYALAQIAIDSAVDIDPLNRDARQLQSLVSSHLQLQGSQNAKPGATTSIASAGGVRRLRGLDEEQIARVRRGELSRNDRVRIQFRNNVRKRFVDSQPGMAYGAFSTRSDMDQAFAIFAKGTQAMINDVLIMNDPEAIASFGRRIHNAVVQGCASSNCHGGDQAGSFRLLSGVPDPATMITNFYLVTQYVQQLEPEHAMAPQSLAMVERGKSRESLLFQYALPRRLAKVKHPQVRGWDGMMRDENDRFARDLTQWIDRDLVRLRPDYGFTFTLQGHRRPEPQATQPATQPVTQPAAQVNEGMP